MISRRTEPVGKTDSSRTVPENCCAFWELATRRGLVIRGGGGGAPRDAIGDDNLGGATRGRQAADLDRGRLHRRLRRVRGARVAPSEATRPDAESSAAERA